MATFIIKVLNKVVTESTKRIASPIIFTQNVFFHVIRLKSSSIQISVLQLHKWNTTILVYNFKYQFSSQVHYSKMTITIINPWYACFDDISTVAHFMKDFISDISMAKFRLQYMYFLYATCLSAQRGEADFFMCMWYL